LTVLPFAAGAALKAVPWKLVGIAAALAAVGWLWWSRGEWIEDAERAEARAESAEQTARDNALALEALQQAHVEALRQIEAADEARRARDRVLARDLREVRDAPNDADGPVAPVLRSALDRLRRAGAGDPEQGGEGPPAGTAADLR
jgi:hypothetical protein